MALPQELMDNIAKLSPGKLNEVADFVEFLYRKENSVREKPAIKTFKTRKLGLMVKFNRKGLYDETVSH